MNNRKIVVDAGKVHELPVILHEMIHDHEIILDELMPVLKEILIIELYNEKMENEMWPLINAYVDELEYIVLREIFVNNQSLKFIADKYSLSYHKVRDIKARALRRLRTGKAKNALMEKYAFMELSCLYRGGLSRFNQYCDSTSISKTRQ